jgi:ABC-type dipeptide/oligopeptide/nickel transport system permease subunit
MNESQAITALQTQTRQQTIMRLLPRDIGGIIGITLTTIIILTAIFAQQIAPYGYKEGSRRDARIPPAWVDGGSMDHLLGTDQQGWDIFSRIVYGSQVSLTVGIFGAGMATLLGVILGTASAFFGGFVDTAVTSFTNLILSVPYLVLVIVVATIFGRSLLNVILIFGVTGSPVFIRMVRGEVFRIREQEYIFAARSLGARPLRLMVRHIFPNLLGALITLATLEVSSMIFYEAGLSFLGLSVPPDVPSWGNMVASGRRFLVTGSNTWIAVFPGFAIAIMSLGVNLFGDWLRDVFDPHVN